jgi:phytoene/squalene synthetase
MADDLVPSPHRFAVRHRMAIRALAEFREAVRSTADDEAMPAEERSAQLERLVARSGGEAQGRLVQAFRKDVSARPFRNWSELIGHCQFAAAPVGRFLLELHGEDGDRVRAAEALYAAKHILHRLRACKSDYLDHGRVYLPGDWLKRAGVESAALGANRAGPDLRRVFGQVLDGVEDMIRVARPDLSRLADRRLRIAMQTEIAAARRLAASLRRSDPLARTVALSRPALLLCVVAGHARGYWRP